MKALILGLAVVATAAGLAAQATYVSPTVPVTIPDTPLQGYCQGLVGAGYFGVPPSGDVLDLDVSVGLSHPRSGDLRIWVNHEFITIQLADNLPFDASPFSGTYVFDDEAALTLDEAMTMAPGAIPVPGGSYRGDGPLSAFDGMPAAGDWVVSVCDYAPGYMGDLTFVSFTITTTTGSQTVVFTVDQQIVLTNNVVTLSCTGGTPGNTCFRVLAFNAGNYPNGWFFGIDAGIGEIVGAYAFGWPFLGPFNANGYNAQGIGLPVGIGITLYGVALDLDPITLVPVGQSAPIDFVLN